MGHKRNFNVSDFRKMAYDKSYIFISNVKMTCVTNKTLWGLTDDQVKIITDWLSGFATLYGLWNEATTKTSVVVRDIKRYVNDNAWVLEDFFQTYLYDNKLVTNTDLEGLGFEPRDEEGPATKNPPTGAPVLGVKAKPSHKVYVTARKEQGARFPGKPANVTDVKLYVHEGEYDPKLELSDYRLLEVSSKAAFYVTFKAAEIGNIYTFCAVWANKHGNSTDISNPVTVVIQI